MDFYIVNYTEGGFALLAGDTRAETDVYAFSEEGTISLSDTANNPGLKHYLTNIMYPPSHSVIINPGLDPDKFFKFTKNVPPLASQYIADWNQTSPFSKYTRNPVGCVVLAMAQAVATMEWPKGWVSHYQDHIFESFSFIGMKSKMTTIGMMPFIA